MESRRWSLIGALTMPQCSQGVWEESVDWRRAAMKTWTSPHTRFTMFSPTCSWDKRCLLQESIAFARVWLFVLLSLSLQRVGHEMQSCTLHSLPSSFSYSHHLFGQSHINGPALQNITCHFPSTLEIHAKTVDVIS